MAIFRREPPLTGASNAGGVGKKCGVRRPLFAQDDDEVFVTGSTLYAEDKGRSTLPPDTTPFVITPFSAAVGRTSYNRTRSVFLLNTDTNLYYPTHKVGS